MLVGRNPTVTYLCLCGSIVKTSGFTSKAKPSLLLYDLGFTENLTVQGILLGFIILNLSFAPSVFFAAISVPNQNTRSCRANRLAWMTV